MMDERAMSRGEIANVLRRWQAGFLTAEGVHEWADGLYFPGRLEFDDEEGPDEESVANYVMSALGMLDVNLMVVEDVAIYLDFLETPPGEFERGYREFERAISAIDHRERRVRLAQIPLYAPFGKDGGTSA